MKPQTKLMIACALLLSIAACKKETTTVTVKDKLVAKAWKSTALVSNGVTEASWCWLSSIYEYTNSGNLYYTQGDNLGACSGAAIGSISTLHYKVSADEKYIIFLETSPSSADTLEIVSLTDQVLKTKRVVNKNSPSPSTWEDTFTAQ